SCGRLKLLAEEGSIKIFWEGKEITKGNGLMAAINLDEEWKEAENDWQVEKISEDTLKIRSKWDKINLTQEWLLKVNRDKGIEWEINLKGEGIKELRKIDIGIRVTALYKGWMGLAREGEFGDEFRWEDVYNHKVGLVGLWDLSENLPGILFEADSGEGIIQNTDDFFNARIIKIRKILEEGFLFRGRIILGEEKELRNYLEEKRRIEEKKRSISCGRLKLLAEEGSIKIFWEGKEITKGKGLYTAINSLNKWYHSFDFPIKIEKLNEKNLAIIVYYPHLSLKEYIKLNILTEKEISLEIEMELEKEILFSNRDVRLEVISIYQTWLTDEEEGFFSEKFFNGISPVRLKNNRVKALGLKEKDGLPHFIFSINNTGNWLSSLYKRKEEDEKIVLQFSEIIPKKNQKFFPGRYTFFKGKIIFDRELARKEIISCVYPIIKKEDLEFVFAEGRGRIFWKDMEITSGLGMYTSFRVKGIWYDSSLAIWEIRENTSREIEVLGSWPYISLSQFWKISLSDVGKILWRVETEIAEKTDLELEHIGLMFIPEYKNWIAQNIYKGDFSEEFSEDYDILPFRFFYGRADELKSSVPGLPSLIFRVLNKDNSLRAMIGNSDYLYKARLFQYQRNLAGEILKLKEHFLGEVELK
ncbi:MAG: hypothetical protein ACK4NT_02265, partial [Candidatus Omnitrophota bacterium]